jgi:Uma2 family endonuclease
MIGVMSTAARSRATYEDVLAAPEHLVAEIVDGELELTPRPALPHAAAASALSEELGPPFKRGRGGPGGWLIVYEPELRLGDDIVVPDLAGWRRERLDKLPNAPFLTLAPDWACEVLSPASARFDRTRKRPVYARSGVRWLWFVDAIARTLETFELRDGQYTLLDSWGDDAKVRAVPFDAIELDLSVLWSDVERE